MKKLGSLWILEDGLRDHLIGGTGHKNDVRLMINAYLDLRPNAEASQIIISQFIDGVAEWEDSDTWVAGDTWMESQ